MKPLQKALCVSTHVIKSCSKATGKVTHFLVSKVIGAGGSVTIQSLLLASNAWLLYAGVKAWRRARFANTVRLLTDLDEDGLKYVLKNLPAWVKFSDYERAKFLNDSVQMLWPAFDTALCNLIKDELEPHMRDFSPSVVNGLFFERLSFGLVPMSIMGVRIAPPQTSSGSNVAIELDIDVRWAGEPDVLLKLEPSNKWLMNAVKIGKLKVLPAVNMTPVMAVRVRTVQMSAVLRVTMSPVLDDLPFIGGVALSFITQPYLDFDLRLVAGPDIMSVPALASYMHASLMDVFVDQMIWPKSAQIPFMMPPSEENDIKAPQGILKVQVIEARLPQRMSRLRRVEKRVDPYACLAIRPHEGQNDVGTQSASTSGKQDTTHPHWREAFHMCVGSMEQILEVVVAHAAGTADPNADIPLGRVDIPIKEILREAARPSGQRLASAAKVAYKLRQAAQRARAAVEARRAADMLRRESEPAGHDDRAELAPDLRSDSAPASSEHFDAKAFCSALTLPDGTPGKPPRGPFGSGKWRSKSDVSKDKHIKTGYTRPLSAEHLRCQESSSSGDGPHALAQKLTAIADTGEDKADMGHVVEAATIPPVSPNMQGMSLYRSPSKIMPSLPSHTPHKAAHEAALAVTAEEGSWLPLLPINAYGGLNPTPESFFPTLPSLSLLVEDAAEGFSSLFSRTSPDMPGAGDLEDSKTGSIGCRSMGSVCNSDEDDTDSEPHSSAAAQDYARGSTTTLSFFDFHSRSSKSESARSSPTKAKKAPRRRFSLFGEPQKTGSAKSSAAESATRQQGRVLGKTSSRRSSNGRTARLRRGKTDVAGAVRLQLSFLPVSSTPQPYRNPQDPIVSSPRATPEEGLEGGEARRSLVPPQRPLVVGALAVMLLASSINEVKLGIPAVSIRLGLQTHRTQLASGNPSGRAEWNFRCCFALELPNVYDDIKVTIGDATKTLASRIWDTWIPFGSESETEVTTVASCRIPLADILAAGKASGTWKMMRPDKLGQTRPCGHISMRCAWLPALPN
ncbi:g11108 [Coccomyxa viridis]|uniref:G11108 protein n=1 Tax=Coccomyxa viridis TaxID=1274662 RepID=A0ABP1G732_9CHLO